MFSHIWFGQTQSDPGRRGRRNNIEDDRLQLQLCLEMLHSLAGWLSSVPHRLPDSCQCRPESLSSPAHKVTVSVPGSTLYTVYLDQIWRVWITEGDSHSEVCIQSDWSSCCRSSRSVSSGGSVGAGGVRHLQGEQADDDLRPLPGTGGRGGGLASW